MANKERGRQIDNQDVHQNKRNSQINIKRGQKVFNMAQLQKRNRKTNKNNPKTKTSILYLKSRNVN